VSSGDGLRANGGSAIPGESEGARCGRGCGCAHPGARWLRLSYVNGTERGDTIRGESRKDENKREDDGGKLWALLARLMRLRTGLFSTTSCYLQSRLV